jgi:hypothetical protein
VERSPTSDRCREFVGIDGSTASHDLASSWEQRALDPRAGLVWVVLQRAETFRAAVALDLETEQ